jgi:hypothetical protein
VPTLPGGVVMARWRPIGGTRQGRAVPPQVNDRALLPGSDGYRPPRPATSAVPPEKLASQPGVMRPPVSRKGRAVCPECRAPGVRLRDGERLESHRKPGGGRCWRTDPRWRAR